VEFLAGTLLWGVAEQVRGEALLLKYCTHLLTVYILRYMRDASLSNTSLWTDMMVLLVV
jgi:hypothetical protein